MHGGSCRIVIPTRDGGRWLGPMARAYARLGVFPLYLLDSRTADDSRDVLGRAGAEVVEVTPEHDRSEDVLWRGAAAAGAEWVLRLDDDEMPSRALLGWIAREGAARPEAVVHLSSRQFWRGGYSRLEAFYFNHARPDFLTPQPRLFRPGRVRCTDALHTPGIVVAEDGWAPDTAFYMHFDWALRSLPERLRKLARYEAQRPGGGTDFAKFYLPEYYDAERLRVTPLGTDEFDPLLDELGIG